MANMRISDPNVVADQLCEMFPSVAVLLWDYR